MGGDAHLEETMAPNDSLLGREPLGLDFDRTASWMAYLSAAVALAYSVSFGYYVREGDRWAQYTSSGLLIAGGLIGLPVLVAIYLRVRHVDEGFAIVGLLVAAAAAFGTVLHGAHDIAVFAHPDKVTTSADYPNFTDPRGFSTFALFGLGMIVLAAMTRGAGFAKPIPLVGAISGVLAVIVYIGRVTVLDPKRWWVAIAAVGAGVVGVPLWNVLVARSLRSGHAVARVAQPKAPPARNASISVVS
jgi:hypothetical protein